MGEHNSSDYIHYSKQCFSVQFSREDAASSSVQVKGIYFCFCYSVCGSRLFPVESSSNNI